MKEPSSHEDTAAQRGERGEKMSWSCEDTAAHMEAYALDALEAEVADRLVEHVLRCPHCYATHWAPLAEDASRLEEGLLDELMGDEGGEDGGLEPPPTFDGTGLDTQQILDEGGLETRQVLDEGGLETTQPASDGRASEARFRLEPGSGAWLREVGTVLPPVPKPELIRAYHWYLGGGAPRPDNQGRALARIWVEGYREASRVWVEGLKEGAILDGSPVLPGQRLELRWTHLLACGASRYLIEIAEEDNVWKGVGLLRHAGPSWPLKEGPNLLGRERSRCAIALRDQPGNGNLDWQSGVLERVDAKQRARLRQLTLDSVEVSRVHAELLKEGKTFRLRGRTRYPVYRIRGGAVKSTREGMESLSIIPGDLLRIGHQLFEYREV